MDDSRKRRLDQRSLVEPPAAWKSIGLLLASVLLAAITALLAAGFGTMPHWGRMTASPETLFQTSR